MIFNSIDFLIFFPIVVCIYFVIPKKLRYLWLLAASYYFYMCWNPAYIVLIVISTLITYVCGLLVGKIRDGGDVTERKRLRLMRVVLAVSLIMNLGILIYFKYTNFLIGALNPILEKMHIRAVSTLDILLPVGISFYTFQAIGYTIDVYRGDTKAEKNIVRYALFISFFPQLVAGPIERSKNLLQQMKDIPRYQLWDYQRVTSGLMTMVWGFFQKVVIADRIAVLVNHVFANYEQYQMTALWAGAIAFAIQIYCDFSGYSTIAIGAAKVLGFNLIENFDTPYFAQSVSDFWRRWHISLSRWFRDYVYIPLGGNRCGKLKKYRNLMITFGVSGLWHGANWTYLVWGLLHGAYQIIEKELEPVMGVIHKKCHTRTTTFGYRLFKSLVTFIMVDIAWIFFRASSLKQAVHYIRRMFLYRDWWSLFDQSIYKLGLDIREMHILYIALLVLLAVEILKYKNRENLTEILSRQWIGFRWGVLLFLIYMCVVFGYYGPGFQSSQFIYFQF